jgi:hypothetical protein
MTWRWVGEMKLTIFMRSPQRVQTRGSTFQMCLMRAAQRRWAWWGEVRAGAGSASAAASCVAWALARRPLAALE